MAISVSASSSSCECPTTHSLLAAPLEYFELGSEAALAVPLGQSNHHYDSVGEPALDEPGAERYVLLVLGVLVYVFVVVRRSVAAMVRGARRPVVRPVRHFKYYSPKKKNRRRNRNMSGSDFDHSNRFDSNPDNSDYFSDAAINPNLMPHSIPPPITPPTRTFSSSSMHSHHSHHSHHDILNHQIHLQSEAGVPVSTSVPSFTFPSRNSSMCNSAPPPPPPSFTVSPPPSSTLPPVIHRASSANSKSSAQLSLAAVGSVGGAAAASASAIPEDTTDQKSFKSSFSKTSKTSTQHQSHQQQHAREYEQTVKLRDEEEEGEIKVVANNTTATSTATGVGGFWRRTFSRPSSIHELSVDSGPPLNEAVKEALAALVPASSATATTPSSTATGLLPKLSLFKRKPTDAVLSAGAGGGMSPGVVANNQPSGSAPASPGAASVMKSFWPLGKSSAKVVDAGEGVLVREREGEGEGVGMGTVPVLEMPVPRKRKGKGVVSVSEGKEVEENGAEKTAAATTTQRFWPSALTPSASAGAVASAAEKGKTKAHLQAGRSASSSSSLMVEESAAGRSGSVKSHEGVAAADVSVGSLSSGTKSFWGKQKTAAISYAKAVSKTEDAGVERVRRESVASGDTRESGGGGGSRSSMNTDEERDGVDRGGQSWERGENKQETMLSRFSKSVSVSSVKTKNYLLKPFQSSSSSATAASSTHPANHNTNMTTPTTTQNNSSDARSVSAATSTSASSSAAAKFFGLKKRTSNEAIKSEYLRLLAMDSIPAGNTPPPSTSTTEYLNQTNGGGGGGVPPPSPVPSSPASSNYSYRARLSSSYPYENAAAPPPAMFVSDYDQQQMYYQRQLQKEAAMRFPQQQRGGGGGPTTPPGVSPMRGGYDPRTPAGEGWTEHQPYPVRRGE
ncbi:hypothetical protein HDU98_011768, partial [Podochytrium sp. JEL0797]